jgi:insertion element IS1 protein InsB
MNQCPYCHSSSRQVKAGHNPTGSQRFQCQHCRRAYTPEPNPAGYPDEIRQQAVRLYLDGNNFRRIGRILQVNHQSVINWVNLYHAQLQQQPTGLAIPEANDTLEVDELFTFIGSKKNKPTS